MKDEAVPTTVEVTPERLHRWLAGFAERHGAVRWDASAEAVEVTAADGAVALCAVPFPPLVVRDDAPYGGLLDHAAHDRIVGALLVRRGGYAAGVFHGSRLTSSKVGSRHVQGKSKAGGWSQQRFARRREQQARVAFSAAADAAERVLVPAVPDLQTLVCGGDRVAVDAVLADKRLVALLPLVESRALYAVPDPRKAVLEKMPRRFRAVHISVTNEPPA